MELPYVYLIIRTMNRISVSFTCNNNNHNDDERRTSLREGKMDFHRSRVGKNLRQGLDPLKKRHNLS